MYPPSIYTLFINLWVYIIYLCIYTVFELKLLTYNIQIFNFLIFLIG